MQVGALRGSAHGINGGMSDCKIRRMVGTGRFELPTPRTPSECSTRLSHVPTTGNPLFEIGGLSSGRIDYNICRIESSRESGQKPLPWPTGRRKKRGVELGERLNPEAQAILIVHASYQKNIAGGKP